MTTPLLEYGKDYDAFTIARIVKDETLPDIFLNHLMEIAKEAGGGDDMRALPYMIAGTSRVRISHIPS